MGSTAADGSMATTCDAIREVRPKVIFLVGIAFGVKRHDHRIGDVLIAKHIRPYGMYKAKPETIEQRGYTIPASVQLMKWTQDRTREWRFLRADGSSARIIPPAKSGLAKCL
jgi:nucleoside phosphorylase